MGLEQRALPGLGLLSRTECAGRAADGTSLVAPCFSTLSQGSGSSTALPHGELTPLARSLSSPFSVLSPVWISLALPPSYSSGVSEAGKMVRQGKASDALAWGPSLRPTYRWEERTDFPRLSSAIPGGPVPYPPRHKDSCTRDHTHAKTKKQKSPLPKHHSPRNLI